MMQVVEASAGVVAVGPDLGRQWIGCSSWRAAVSLEWLRDPCGF